jgi:hypothetical protein
MAKTTDRTEVTEDNVNDFDRLWFAVTTPAIETLLGK